MKNVKKNNCNKRWVFSGYIALFVLFLSALPLDSIYGLERIVSTIFLASLISYLITNDWKKSVVVGLGFTVLMGLLDSRGPFSDYSRKVYNLNDNLNDNLNNNYYYLEKFDVKPAGTTAKDRGKAYADEQKTEDTDNTNLNDEDLDKILDADEKGNNDENEHLKKAGGGLDQLKDLLDMAKKESPFKNKDINEYTPSEAQRATYHLIDSVKQLKTTINEMAPLIKTGKHLMSLREKMTEMMK